MSDKCPKCGEEIVQSGHRFRLAGQRSEERCIQVQRDQLLARISTLRLAVATAWTHGYHRGFNAENYDEAWEKSDAKRISEQK